MQNRILLVHNPELVVGSIGGCTGHELPSSGRMLRTIGTGENTVFTLPRTASESNFRGAPVRVRSHFAPPTPPEGPRRRRPLAIFHLPVRDVNWNEVASVEKLAITPGLYHSSSWQSHQLSLHANSYHSDSVFAPFVASVASCHLCSWCKHDSRHLSHNHCEFFEGNRGVTRIESS